MWPKLRFVWQTPASERVEKITVDTAAAPEDGVDLLTQTSSDFPQFLGPNRSGWIPGPSFDSDWTANPPTQIWKQEIGAGWSSFAIVNGFAVTMEQRHDQELVTCYDVMSGELQWAHSLSTRHETLLGGIGPRATPTIDEGRVYAMGATGTLRCLAGRNGDLIWEKDIVTEFGGTHEDDESSIAWGRSGSPLVVDDKLIVPVGCRSQHSCTLVAFDKISGDVIWLSGDSLASYASPGSASICSVRQVLYVAEDKLISCEVETGTVLWEWKWPGASNAAANASQAHALDGDRVFVSKGYGGGCELLQLSVDKNKWQVESIWKSNTTLKTKFSNVVIHDGLAFGLDDRILECVDLQTGRKIWKKGRYGFGQVLGVGDHIIVQAEDGRIVLVEAARKFNELASIAAIEGKTWNNPAIYGQYLLVRNSEQAACFLLPDFSTAAQ
ncbi:MAG: PQQ-binding-like beta-propeller repeat protein, partial [Planctomycetales bacterium]|nr:PQQ-binding-like beta-propeller repeat protein [Planctomycetales bacterium]